MLLARYFVRAVRKATSEISRSFLKFPLGKPQLSSGKRAALNGAGFVR